MWTIRDVGYQSPTCNYRWKTDVNISFQLAAHPHSKSDMTRTHINLQLQRCSAEQPVVEKTAVALDSCECVEQIWSEWLPKKVTRLAVHKHYKGYKRANQLTELNRNWRGSCLTWAVLVKTPSDTDTLSWYESFMPCRLLLDRLSTPVSGSIIKVILSFPERILYLREKNKSSVSIMLQNSILLGKCWKHKCVLFLSCPETKTTWSLEKTHK